MRHGAVRSFEVGGVGRLEVGRIFGGGCSHHRGEKVVVGDAAKGEVTARRDLPHCHSEGPGTERAGFDNFTETGNSELKQMNRK